MCIRDRTRSLKHDVVALPFAGLAGCIDEGWPLSVNRAGLSVGVGEVVGRVEHLNFVSALQKDAAVASVLTVAADLSRRSPFDVQLDIAELFFGSKIAGVGCHFHVAVLEFPGLTRRRPL